MLNINRECVSIATSKWLLVLPEKNPYLLDKDDDEIKILGKLSVNSNFDLYSATFATIAFKSLLLLFKTFLKIYF